MVGVDVGDGVEVEVGVGVGVAVEDGVGVGVSGAIIVTIVVACTKLSHLTTVTVAV